MASYRGGRVETSKSKVRRRPRAPKTARPRRRVRGGRARARVGGAAAFRALVEGAEPREPGSGTRPGEGLLAHEEVRIAGVERRGDLVVTGMQRPRERPGEVAGRAGEHHPFVEGAGADHGAVIVLDLNVAARVQVTLPFVLERDAHARGVEA